MPERAWNMDEATRNRLLKKYKTQVASATSTVCATLSVVSTEPATWRASPTSAQLRCADHF